VFESHGRVWITVVHQGFGPADLSSVAQMISNVPPGPTGYPLSKAARFCAMSVARHRLVDRQQTLE
jgi:hypothetical protein